MRTLLALIVSCELALASSLIMLSGTGATVTTITMGETEILATADGNNANYMLASRAVLGQDATIKSISYYVDTAAGNIILGVYASDGPSAQPGTKLAETASFAASAGWNTQNVVSESVLTAGAYWLVYHPNNAALAGRRFDGGAVAVYYTPHTYDGTLPTPFSTTPSEFAGRASIYATLQP